MNVERDTLIEAGVAVLSVLIFIAIMVAGVSNGGSGLDQTGAYTVVGSIVAFVVVMSILGYWLSTRD